MTEQIGLVGGFLGGVLSILSPCSALLLPAFFAYAFGTRRLLLARTGLFLLGLATVLVPLGAGMGAIGSLFTIHRGTVTLIGGLVVVVLGVYTALGGGFRLPGLSDASSRVTGSGPLSVLALGALYGFAGFCSGPLLGGVLTLAMAGGSPAYGAAVMGAYAIGMVVPLAVLALAWDSLGLSRRRLLRGRELTLGPIRTHTTSVIAGVLFVAVGLLFVLSDGTAAIGSLMGVDEQFELQLAVERWVAGVDDLWFLVAALALAAVILAGWVLHDRRRARADRPGEEQAREGRSRDQSRPSGQEPARS
ncbi:MAG: cytochrome c biogenesis CcdA family protein [Dietzia sp.]|uniref:cytochrome c biogenesis CcdA family protein n=1 Tax=Dietzia sp. TaxID=1871616 RepID=UPI0027263023|nr:cytochrome c biogenesis CcdA family protein [Dietzia sp.]MDO8395543.1 cytochrome c biogenesis CcdA family protein [Dietzia sp.]